MSVAPRCDSSRDYSLQRCIRSACLPTGGHRPEHSNGPNREFIEEDESTSIYLGSPAHQRVHLQKRPILFSLRSSALSRGPPTPLIGGVTLNGSGASLQRASGVSSGAAATICRSRIRFRLTWRAITNNGEAVSGSYHAPAKAGGTVTAPTTTTAPWDDLELGLYCNLEDDDRECPEGHSCEFWCMYPFWYNNHDPALAYTGGLRRGLRAGEEGLRRGHAFGDSSGYFQGELTGNLNSGVPPRFSEATPEFEEWPLPDPPRDYHDRALAAAVLPRRQGHIYVEWLKEVQVNRCINSRRRRKRGLRPMYGMGWMGGNAGHAQHNNAHAYNNNNDHHPPPAYGAPQGPSYPMHSPHPSNGYYGQQEGVQQPKNTYAPAGANDYAPPPGPPPSGRH
ncbi:hypothetical protein DL764_005321 [Monosporascus ibericus]|uniref:Uncharacterized protein n=1 Tax=Monosporascus ibericus TaxID=155417 RepID=A0A4Q4TBD0_9PEZI|nr:hypothetical protein DL764_005321 [Monosporascus ibericus]